jgi:hypothetical protein
MNGEHGDPRGTFDTVVPAGPAIVEIALATAIFIRMILTHDIYPGIKLASFTRETQKWLDLQLSMANAG